MQNKRTEYLIPSTVFTDRVFKNKKATWVGKWKPSKETVAACDVIDRSIVNPKGKVNGGK